MSEKLTIEEELDFSGRGKFQHKQEEKQVEQIEKKINFGKFKKVAIGVIGAAVLTAGGFGIHTAVINHQKEVIQQEEAVIRATSLDDLLAKMDSEKEENTNYFNKNKSLLSQYAKSQNMIGILGLQNSVTGKQSQNETLHSQINNNIEQDKSKISNVYKAAVPSQTFDYKKDILLGEDYDKFKAWKTSVDTNQLVYVGQLVKLGDSINQELTMLDSLEKEMVNTVQTKIKTGDYNLYVTERYLVDKIAKKLYSETDFLRSVKSEISGSAQEYLLTNSDILSAEYAINGIVRVAQEKIDSDKNNVENLIKNYNSSGNLSFNDYYTVYSWLAGSSVNQPAAMATGNTNNKLQETTEGKYSISNKNSYLNQYLSSNNAVRDYRYQLQSASDRAYNARRVYREDQERIRLEAERARIAQQQAEEAHRAELKRQHEAEMKQMHSQSQEQQSHKSQNGYKPVEKKDSYSYSHKSESKPEPKVEKKVEKNEHEENKYEVPKKKYKYEL